MISDLMLSEIEAMRRDGLRPTPEDIVRLNAIGLKAERGPDAAALYSMRRAIRLTPQLTLREPTIAHALFYDECARLPEFADASVTRLVALRAWTLALIDAPDKPVVASEIIAEFDRFVAGPLASASLSQTASAVDYCLHGLDQCELEYPEPEPDAAEPPRDFAPELVAVSDAIALGLGVSLDDAHRMTRARLAAIVQCAQDKLCLMMPQDRAGAILRERKNARIAEFNRTADAIRARLSADRAKGDCNG